MHTYAPFDLVETAQHEAAHIVVGLALGLRLLGARVRREVRGGEPVDGWADFDARTSTPLEWALMLAAGIAWDEAIGESPECSAGDREGVIAQPGLFARDVPTLVRVAGTLLSTLGPQHARVTRALVDRGALTREDGLALMRGEPLPDPDG